MTMPEASSDPPGFPAVPASDMERKVVGGLVTHIEPVVAGRVTHLETAAFWLQRDPDKAQDMADILASGEDTIAFYIIMHHASISMQHASYPS